ncbi:carboxynorspermidine/carboxyspermidine decarboxylase [Neiella marina]|uniref:Carboxynorspermidine/carboxyspermidine decarboxylase n=1 Tax=Neiella marina TaxID=508461 RepID=A0A8J2U8W4_9GAMM|nr:carboxynorspermidine decarboxylase [Neiella marina]GGA87506.1 carboxynorspermidine/carboxyspermidine decarboxylase [Neiella marina]
MTNVVATTFSSFDPNRVPSPCFVVDEVAVEHNLKILARVQKESGAKVLLALKAFSMFALAPLVKQYLSGTCASGLHEAKLGYEEFGGQQGSHEVHTFSAAFTAKDLPEILQISNHVVFNSFAQWQRFQRQIQAALVDNPKLDFGLRINPMHSEGTTPIYDPCAPGSRLGIPLAEFSGQDLSGISGLHFHTLCEQGFDPLDRTLAAVERQFGHLLGQMKWVNFGGGHHISHPDYDVDGLIARIKAFSAKYDVQVYLEPGEAIAIRSGVLVSEVLDLTHNQMDLAILDTSATCHMPDTLEMPYRAEIWQAGEPGEKAHDYRLGGQTCLAGDVMGDYSFDKPLQVGQRLMFDDMSHYTMVKTSTFNGIGLPAIALWNSQTDELRVAREFDYDDFKHRLS